jgi:phosphomannomutase
VEIGPTGHSLAKRRMRHGDYILGGEPSAHYYFADHYNLDDAVYAACLIAALVADAPSTSQIFEGLPVFVSSPEIPVPCDDLVKFQIAEAAGDHFAQNHDVLRVDGARISFPATPASSDGGEGWSLIRASNTGPNLTIRFEATTESRYQQIRAEIIAHLRAYPELTIPDDLGAL